MRNIIELKLKKVRRRIEANYKAPFRWTNELVDAIAARCKEVESGARNVDHILTKTLLPELAAEFLARMAEGRKIVAVEAGVDENGRFRYGIEDR